MNNTHTLPIDESPAGSAARTDHLYLVLAGGKPGGGARWSLAGIDRVEIGRGARARDRSDGPTLRVDCPDPYMSSSHLRFERERAHWVARRCRLAQRHPRQRREAGPRDRHRPRRGRGRPQLLHAARRTSSPAPRELDRAPAIRLRARSIPSSPRAFDELRRIAQSDIPVLVGGPTGTGKERVARAIHAMSRRAARFVPVNCGALPAALVESELFGHKKGAFSGAIADAPGLVVASSGGTLFLDEIGDLPARRAGRAAARARGARGARRSARRRVTRVDLRVVAATHRDLDAMIEDGAVPRGPARAARRLRARAAAARRAPRRPRRDARRDRARRDVRRRDDPRAARVQRGRATSASWCARSSAPPRSPAAARSRPRTCPTRSRPRSSPRRRSPHPTRAATSWSRCSRSTRATSVEGRRRSRPRPPASAALAQALRPRSRALPHLGVGAPAAPRISRSQIRALRQARRLLKGLAHAAQSRESVRPPAATVSATRSVDPAPARRGGAAALRCRRGRCDRADRRDRAVRQLARDADRHRVVLVVLARRQRHRPVRRARVLRARVSHDAVDRPRARARRVRAVWLRRVALARRRDRAVDPRRRARAAEPGAAREGRPAQRVPRRRRVLRSSRSGCACSSASSATGSRRASPESSPSPA